MVSIERIIRYVTTKLRGIAARGTLTHCTDVAGDAMRCQVTTDDGGANSNAPYPQHYGHAALPPAGCKPFGVSNGGDSGAMVIVAMCDVTYRIPLKEGEAVLYDDLGQKVHLTRTGIAVETPLNAIVKAAQKLRLEAAEIEIHATESFRFDVNGHGQHWFPTKVDAWTIGEEAGAPHPITPPEIG